ncbi:hypothetical protein [Natrinema salaciae]|uniref:DUF8060 domain-containing protein n=1 Tax=Natrinema salaciae TaxID=1186196 RepID=A0A1H9LLS5_9EURY|nr:hypothetical protein [Natrinema salaciae]SER12370.1 hypothetical protein SAMN04489841_3010 [Natrinema salaciae]
MTDTPTQTQAETSIDAETEATTDRSGGEPDAVPSTTGSDAAVGFGPGSDGIQRYLAWGALGVCSLLAVFALIQFYGSVTNAIDLWVDAKYQPLIRAAFNLAVLLTSLIGVSLLVRELNAGSADR